MDDDRDVILLRVHAETELLRSVAAFLCVATIPKDVLDIYIEGLDIPVVSSDPKVTKFAHEAIGRFLGQISENRRITENKG